MAVPEAESYFETAKRAVYRYERISPKCIRLGETAKTVAVVGAASGSASADYVQTVKKLIELLELPGGWNSYNAKPISKENVNFAVDLLARVMRVGTPAPTVVPKVRGGVQLEWHIRGLNIEIDISSPHEVSFFAEDIRTTEEPVEEDLDEYIILSQWIDRLSASGR